MGLEMISEKSENGTHHFMKLKKKLFWLLNKVENLQHEYENDSWGPFHSLKIAQLVAHH